ncbi:hypothetical protein OIO90_003804 [Microbotryomycetes sp. JL221]|nr:hypothetical protein OIO90_003804 [Microbotryomycetes sp. JL221]
MTSSSNKRHKPNQIVFVMPEIDENGDPTIPEPDKPQIKSMETSKVINQTQPAQEEEEIDELESSQPNSPPSVVVKPKPRKTRARKVTIHRSAAVTLAAPPAPPGPRAPAAVLPDEPAPVQKSESRSPTLVSDEGDAKPHQAAKKASSSTHKVAAPQTTHSPLQMTSPVRETGITPMTIRAQVSTKESGGSAIARAAETTVPAPYNLPSPEYDQLLEYDDYMDVYFDEQTQTPRIWDSSSRRASLTSSPSPSTVSLQQSLTRSRPRARQHLTELSVQGLSAHLNALVQSHEDEARQQRIRALTFEQAVQKRDVIIGELTVRVAQLTQSRDNYRQEFEQVVAEKKKLEHRVDVLKEIRRGLIDENDQLRAGFDDKGGDNAESR